jgi:uncharacterized protein (DUF885 family)
LKKWLKWAALAVAGVVAIGGVLAAHTWYGQPLSINWFYGRTFAKQALGDPEMLTELRILEQVGVRGHNAQLTDASVAHAAQRYADMKAEYVVFQQYDASALSGQDKVSHAIFDHFIRTELTGERWQFHNHPVNQLFGVQSNVPNLLTQTQQVNDAQDAEHYLARLAALPEKFAQVRDTIKVREKKGIIPQKFVVEKVITQMRGFIATGAKANPLYATFKDKLEKIAGLQPEAREALLARAEREINTSVFPAYQAMITHFEGLRSKATRNDGVWALPDGDAYYQYEIESQTTTKLSAEAIHAIGLREVERITGEMDVLLKQIGLTEGKLAARMDALSKLPTQNYPDSAEGRAQILKDYQAMIDEISAGLAPHFGVLPQASVVVKRVPEFAEKTAPGAYYNSPPMDGSKPGTFFANLRDVKETPRYSMRTLAYHEAVPGHHLQIAIAQELKGLPLFRSIVGFTAYAEGWALYAERLAWEMGFQKTAEDNLGRLQDEMMRAVRLVVDTGIHAKRWTREQAIAYMVENTGMGEDAVVTEIERYFVNPGQALAYKVGMLKILELRERAQKALGPQFSLREFHDVVLTNGSMPLTVLEQVVDAYITSKLAKRA